MIACCLHHVADILPVVGLSGGAVFLSDYKVPPIMVGLGTDGIGTGLMGRVVRHHRRTGAAAESHRRACDGRGRPLPDAGIAVGG